MTDTKTCIDCGATKPIGEFYTRRGYHMKRCKPCERAKIYAAQKRPPRNPTAPGTKRCMDCKAIKPESAFHRNKAYHDGIDRMCKECRYRRHQEWASTHREHLNERQKARYRSDVDRYRDYERAGHYGMKRGQFAQMLEAQGGRCAICGSDDPGSAKRTFHVDHCHDTGIVRGLLCSRCNTGIGHLKHSIDILTRAIAYLQKFPA